MDRKYVLTDKQRTPSGATYWRIRACRDIFRPLPDIGRGNILVATPLVRKGEYGGWVESEDNLSHEGSCWIFGDARAIQHSRVLNNAVLKDRSISSGYSVICKNASLEGRSLAIDFAYITDRACLYGSSIAAGNAHVGRNARMWGSSFADGDSTVFGYMEDTSRVEGGYLHRGVKLRASMVLKDELKTESFPSVLTSDGYTAMVNPDTGSLTAGCRFFKNEEEAILHWEQTRGGTPLGEERLKMVKFLYSLYG